MLYFAFVVPFHTYASLSALADDEDEPVEVHHRFR
jgi:hypothetical protein